MSIESDLKSQQMAAMKAKDSATANVIKMIRTEVMKKRTAKGFTGEVDDTLYKEVIAAYKKSLDKARVTYVELGKEGESAAAELTHEIAFCQKFLPQPLSEEAVIIAVKEVIAGLDVVNPKMAGRIVGMIMKQHKGMVEAALVKTVVDAQLAE